MSDWHSVPVPSAVTGGGVSSPAGAPGNFLRQGEPWPLQPEVPTSLSIEAAADGESSETVLQITFVARLLADPSAVLAEEEEDV